MNRRFLVAVIVGIMAILVAMNMMPKQPQDTGEQLKPKAPVVAKVIIFRATQDIKLKTEITPEMFKAFDTYDTDEAWIKLGGTGITSEAALVGKVSTTKIKASDAFTNQNVTDKILFVPKRLSEAIPPGKVAITIPVDAIQSVGGFVREGDYVDIVGIFSDKTVAEPIRTILAGVQVLSIGSELPTGVPGAPDPKNTAAGAEPQTSIKATPVQQITFAATAGDAEIISLVSRSPQKMTFSLVLRSKADFDMSALKELAEGTKETSVNGGSKEVTMGKALTKKEALEIFAGKPAAIKSPTSGRPAFDPSDPNFNPDLLMEQQNQGMQRNRLQPTQSMEMQQQSPAVKVAERDYSVERCRGKDKLAPEIVK
ncbi:MAG TPA: Flp pilus assembly protein CpaB [Candidatus Wallbacteria bacterium]|nr:Flp pilus assembly protein CpaB [Candidatus Wallbacteria bacterium]